jgi:hypothetical protein
VQGVRSARASALSPLPADERIHLMEYLNGSVLERADLVIERKKQGQCVYCGDQLIVSACPNYHVGSTMIPLSLFVELRDALKRCGR